jgi:hypothetical protein
MQSSFPHLFFMTSKGTSVRAVAKRPFRGINTHHDNAPAHKAKWLRQEIARTKATKVVLRAYSRDVAPTDFFLFGHLKPEITGFTASSPEDILSEIRLILAEIPQEIRVAVCSE